MRLFRAVSFGSWFGRRPKTGRARPLRRSITGRFAVVVFIFAGVQAIVLALCVLALEGIDATRAYVAAEDAFTKAQKAAALDLRRYIIYDKAEDLDAFRRDIAVPVADRIAREALVQASPDFPRAYAAFRAGGNDPRDIPAMSFLLRWSSRWQLFHRAFADWRQGDLLVAELGALADEAAAAQRAGPLSLASRDALRARINAIDDRLTLFEQDFAHDMSKSARRARDWAIRGLLLGGALLTLIGIQLAWRSLRSSAAAERRLAQSEQRFRDFAGVASDWFWETDADHRLSYVAGRIANGEALEPQALVGKTLMEIASGDPGEESWKRHLASLAAHEPFRDFAYSLRAADGTERLWSVSGTPVEDDAGTFLGFRGTASDITRDVLAQRGMRQAKEQAETANRAKSEFLANMSHELRTPLNAILGFAEIIRDRLLGPISDRYAEYAQDIHSSGSHLLGIINDILDLSKVEAGRVELVEEIVDLQGIVRSVVLLLRERVATAELTLKTELPDALLLLRADERKLKQVLMNLLSNAVKFTPPGGEIEVRARIEAARGAVIEVADNGIGIAPEDIERALSPFGQVDSRLSRRYEGTGLGLPLARALAELHGGSLELESAPGRGTTVTVVLPADRLVQREMRRWVAS